jgi:hypothetical protein
VRLKIENLGSLYTCECGWHETKEPQGFKTLNIGNEPGEAGIGAPGSGGTYRPHDPNKRPIWSDHSITVEDEKIFLCIECFDAGERTSNHAWLDWDKVAELRDFLTKCLDGEKPMTDEHKDESDACAEEVTQWTFPNGRQWDVRIGKKDSGTPGFRVVECVGERWVELPSLITSPATPSGTTLLLDNGARVEQHAKDEPIIPGELLSEWIGPRALNQHKASSERSSPAQGLCDHADQLERELAAANKDLEILSIEKGQAREDAANWQREAEVANQRTATARAEAIEDCISQILIETKANSWWSGIRAPRIRALATLPPQHVVVPVEPTLEMLLSGLDGFNHQLGTVLTRYVAIYKAMLTARPK